MIDLNDVFYLAVVRNDNGNRTTDVIVISWYEDLVSQLAHAELALTCRTREEAEDFCAEQTVHILLGHYD